MYGGGRKGICSPTQRQFLGPDISAKTALAGTSSVFDFTESPVGFQKSVRPPRKRSLQNAPIPKLRNFETEDYFKEASQEQRPRWRPEKQPERRQLLSPTPKKPKSGGTQLELPGLSEGEHASPKKTLVPDNLSGLFDELPQSPRKSTLSIKTLTNITSEEPDPQIPKIALELPSIPAIEPGNHLVPRPPKSHNTRRNYGITRSYRAEQDSDNESDGLDAEPVSRTLQPSVDLKVSGLNSRYDQEIEFMAEAGRGGFSCGH
ncbi:hypothetical protein KL950_005065 [Ogataea haglerorum]|uniref:Uncharacterized protein n=1 Tax=Ogataea haglerorum TaxID=1937702 RepID=A0ABQ7R9L9_9ASCO|nr:hypothetical protein KL914_005091 [Ogataea haglerorum]KAG7702796.1 hypothetical protein KL950_005065 [Ogataea haglerorum]KAG7761887.1 hypothetical protein KL946_005113 [Ogataea haglerorum]KAG7805131.1 hypothetical protein KL924_005092 [Ogataea haglerorum]